MNTPNMKTGFGEDYIPQLDRETMLNFATTFSLFTEDAIEIASTYVNHSGRNTVTVEDMNYGLQTRFKHRQFFEQKPDIVQRLKDIKQELGIETKTPSPESINFFDDKVIVNEDDYQQFRVSNCNCNICNRVNDTISNWSSFVKDNFSTLEPLDSRIVESIEVVREKFNV